jgi:hypothetical protein
VAILEGPLFFRFAPEHLVVPIGVERRVDIDQMDAGFRQFAELIQTVPAVNDLGIDQWMRESARLRNTFP